MYSYVFCMGPRNYSRIASLHRYLLWFGAFFLILGTFSLATQAKLSKYAAHETAKASSFKSTKATENRSNKIVEFEVVEFTCVSSDMDSSELIFKEQREPLCQIRILLHPDFFRPPPA